MNNILLLVALIPLLVLAPSLSYAIIPEVHKCIYDKVHKNMYDLSTMIATQGQYLSGVEHDADNITALVDSCLK